MTRNSRGIQSIEVGGRLLMAVARIAKPASLRDLAAEAGMPPAKAHPYLVSFVRLGLIEQDPTSGHYHLGPLALELGLISLNLLSPVRIATQCIGGLAAEIDQTIALATWGTHGPTIIALVESSRPIHVNLRVGTVMALLETATGRVFAANLPRKRVETAIEAGLDKLAVGYNERDWGDPRIERSLREVRNRGFDRAVGQPIPGINAISAPVFDHTGAMVLAITAMGPAMTFDPDWEGPIAEAVRRCAGEVSRRLGYNVHNRVAETIA